MPSKKTLNFKNFGECRGRGFSADKSFQTFLYSNLLDIISAMPGLRKLYIIFTALILYYYFIFYNITNNGIRSERTARL